ncbi:GPO family capsid scaffolding protein [Pseudomonas sp. TMW 2.1634]|uniref:GPO family capsid scaffolding protein n=1 Tax=Pseudomonas sp. TMW 2.1634 TaxID=1886807 RepID=UPI000E754286|nr:GPO family capsid scaffolding protein [Pseudomonas sp. TMW 2.1634]AOA08369.1 capsid scaffolding protein [Pseudomonas sp. TMW 2.1634]
MPRSLVSFWKRVATSGATADGREILPQALRDIAETYKPSFYTAVIWCDHEREPGSYGTVYAVRLVEEADDLEPGEIALEAQLKPNDRLLFLNDQGQKLFSSIEITPNFRGNGKAYLTGMGVTDEPASVGTQELYFSKKSSYKAYYASSVQLGSLRQEEPMGDLSKLFSMFTGLFKRFGLEEIPDEPTPTPPTESKTPMDEATATALKALLAQLLVICAGIQAVIEPVAVDAPEPKPEPIADVQTAVDDIVTTVEQDREFRRKGVEGNAALAAGLARIEQQFSALLNTPQGRVIPPVNGVVDPTKKRVL